MRFDILTLFPEYVDRILSESIIGRARKSGAIEVNAYNIRDYSEDKNRRVDDTPYGGGMGMLMAAPPVTAAVEDVKAKAPDKSSRVIYMSPKGRILTQEYAASLAEKYDRLIILCGHYEGIDQRALDLCVDEEISVGDYVLTGGELPACILVDSVARTVDGVLSAPECYQSESIAGGLLEYPQYTRPFEFRGMTVPEVLISGNHAKIDEWRLEQAEKLTLERRPDLYNRFYPDGKPEKKKKGGRKQ
ncbi:MAG: tRNA (guanosine(37)-N1)-methyltransferase TrmD [Clostridia bacterium]|nr:tRNA (guanosine(37)-N1)-methyltransferase TrmD [Clostridia bacterium]